MEEKKVFEQWFRFYEKINAKKRQLYSDNVKRYSFKAMARLYRSYWNLVKSKREFEKLNNLTKLYPPFS